jgi:hypothetical protein
MLRSAGDVKSAYVEVAPRNGKTVENLRVELYAD